MTKLSNRAKMALDVLANGGAFRHGLELNTYTGREQFTYRLKQGGYNVKGVGFAAFRELQAAGLLASAGPSTSVASYYKLAEK